MGKEDSIVGRFREACRHYGGTARIEDTDQEVLMVCEGLSGEDRRRMWDYFKKLLTSAKHVEPAGDER